MKSIMEEASSIAKAIEKAWSRAKNPKEFSVKILEEPQRNFFGLTIKSAKIALFFSDNLNTSNKTNQKQNKQENSSMVSKPKEKKNLEIVKPEIIKKEVKAQKIDSTKKESLENKPEKETREIWPKELISSVEENLAGVLNILNLSHVKYDIKPDNFHLKIKFSSPVFEDKNKEYSFFVSLSTLLLQVLKYKNRRPFKGYKIVLIS